MARTLLMYILSIIFTSVLFCPYVAWAVDSSPNSNTATTQKQQPTPPSAMDEKVHSAIRKAAELTDKTEAKITPFIEQAKEKYQNFSNSVQKQFNDKIATPVGKAVDAVKGKADQYNRYFRQEFGLPEPKKELPTEIKTKQDTSPKTILEKLMGDTGDINTKQTEIFSNPAAATGATDAPDGHAAGNQHDYGTADSGTKGQNSPTVSQPARNKAAPPPGKQHNRPPPRGGGGGGRH